MAKIKDRFGDPIKVIADMDSVVLKVTDSSRGEKAESLLSPKKARALSAMLLTAADLAESGFAYEMDDDE